MSNHLPLSSAGRLASLAIIVIASLDSISALAQDRELRGQRIVLDDNNNNRIILQTGSGITGGTLTLPDPGGAGTILISNPSSGSQTMSADMVPGADDTYDLGIAGTRWQDIFLSADAVIGGEVRFVETGGGTDYVGFQAPTSVATSQTWTLPEADGDSGDVLITDGSGELSWASGGGSVQTNATLTGEGTLGNRLAINLANANTWTATQTFAGAGTSLDVQNGRLAMTNTDNEARELRFQEPSSGGSQYTAFRAQAMTSNTSYALPSGVGSAGQVLGLQTVDLTGDDSATLGWMSQPTATNSTLTGNGSSGSPFAINLGNANTWTGNQTFGGTFLLTSNARIALLNSDNNARDIRWQEPSGAGTQYVGFRAPSVTESSNYVFPSSIGSVGQVLTLATVVNGASADSATLIWSTPGTAPSGAAGGDLTGTYPNPTIAANAIDRTHIADGEVTVAKINTTGAASNNSLMYNGTSVAWGNPRTKMTRVAIDDSDSPYPIQIGTEIVGIDVSSGPVTVSLPSAATSGVGAIIVVKCEAGSAASNNITINRSGTDLINASSTSVLITFGTATGVFRFYSDGVSRWQQW